MPSDASLEYAKASPGQGRGLGRALLAAGLLACLHLGYGSAAISTALRNARAQVPGHLSCVQLLRLASLKLLLHFHPVSLFFATALRRRPQLFYANAGYTVADWSYQLLKPLPKPRLDGDARL